MRRKKKKAREDGLVTEYVGTPIEMVQGELDLLTEEELKRIKEEKEKKKNNN